MALNTENKNKSNNNTDKHQIKNVHSPLWLSVSESAKIGGITTKTIRRALHAQKITYKIIGNRYLINFSSLINYLFSSKKLKNKLIFNGIGQYIAKWREE